MAVVRCHATTAPWVLGLASVGKHTDRHFGQAAALPPNAGGAAAIAVLASCGVHSLLRYAAIRLLLHEPFEPTDATSTPCAGHGADCRQG
jgi:hypothetical protein